MRSRAQIVIVAALLLGCNEPHKAGGTCEYSEQQTTCPFVDLKEERHGDEVVFTATYTTPPVVPSDHGPRAYSETVTRERHVSAAQADASREQLRQPASCQVRRMLKGACKPISVQMLQ